MKILFPIGSFYPAQSGGPNNTVYWHTKFLKKHKIYSIITTTNRDLEDKEDLIPFNTWMSKDFGEVIYTTRKIKKLPFKLVWESLKRLKEVDIIHLSSLFYPASWSIVLINALLYKKKVVWSVRGELDPNALIYSSKVKKIALFCIKKLRQDNIVFHATCDTEVKYIQDTFGAQAKVIHLPNFIEMPEKVSPQNSKPYFLFIGRIHPIKAIDNLLKALSMSETFRQSSIKLKISGNADNDYGNTLKTLTSDLNLSDKVEFIGHTMGKDKQALYANAYFTILPSHTENFGNVIVESLAQGTPVIASKGTPWKLVEDFHAGYWSKNEPETLVQALDKACSLSASDYQKTRESAYQLVREKFDVDKNIEHWIQHYKEVLGLEQK